MILFDGHSSLKIIDVLEKWNGTMTERTIKSLNVVECWMLSCTVVSLSHGFHCVLVTSSFAPEGHSCLCQQSPDTAPFVAQHVQDAPLPPPNLGLCVPVFDLFSGGCCALYGPPPSSPWRSCFVVHCLLFFSTVCCAGARSAVINTNVTCHCTDRPQNRSSPGRKSLWWTENKTKCIDRR